jgi:arabinofuranosyltransferase
MLRPAFILFLLVIVPMQVNNAWQLHKGLDKRLGIYSAVGKWLQKNTPIGSHVGTLEVGIIGYFSERIMVDFAGLIQPDIAAQIGPNKSYADSAWFAVNKFRPDYLVLHANHFPRLEIEYCRQACLKVKRFIGAEYGYSADMDVYQCGPKSQKE